MFGLNKAFRIEMDENDKAVLMPVTSIEHVYLDDLVGYEIQKKKLKECRIFGQKSRERAKKELKIMPKAERLNAKPLPSAFYFLPPKGLR